MKHSLKVGFSFGTTSGIITTLGLMVGLHSGTNSKLAVIGGLFTIAIADAFSDALGIHISEEFENQHTPVQIWASTVCAFLAKFIVALTFALPVLTLELGMAIKIGIIWGLSLLSLLSYSIAKSQRINPWGVILEHLVIAISVIIATHYVGDWVAIRFG
ncbi:MAG: hypothetical protein KBB01_00295 [Candidatus Omnitrophica bacterium]|jgi:VIT1/CCC1 family predicted Fe2+/Mn2+ transporter|nr:hypothetical protein [Candidatus Omnitrophota bacterium]